MVSDSAPLRVLIVADDPLSRVGLAALLEAQPGCLVVGQVAADAGWPDAMDTYRPDAVVWDLGWDTTVEAGDDLPDLAGEGLPVVALVPDEALVPAMLAMGVAGVLLRETDGERLVTALSAAARNMVVIDAALSSDLLPSPGSIGAPPTEDLTPREMEVLQLIAEGLPNKTIALRLGISEHTVKFHVNAILGKLGAQSRTEAVVRATRLGLIVL